MLNTDSPFLLLDDARKSQQAAPPRLYADPVRIIEAREASDLDMALEQLGEARREGLHAAGYLSYEAGLALEPRLQGLLPRDRLLPLMWFGIFENYQLLDQHALRALLPDPAGAFINPLQPAISREQYDAAFARVQEYIRAGDIYQANLTFRAETGFAGHPLALYAAIRSRAAAGYGGIVFDGSQWLLSFSPELFFALKSGRLTARPMKGTASRMADETADAEVKAALAADPKQRAENLMIVDLLRNDLSRVAKPGTVAVPQLFEVESYPTVHQMTSTVTAELAAERDVVDVIRQIFPCGSITGAPKMRAMEIIDELEADRRGIYCGSIGRIDPNGDAAFNVAIRTLHVDRAQERLSIGLGSGIVADSHRDDEWRECLAKGRFAAMPNGDDRTAPVDLIETMLFDPVDGISRLEAHLARMKTSAAALGFEFDRHAARNTIQAITFHHDTAAKLRLRLARSGVIAIQLQPLDPPVREPVACVAVPLAAQPSDYRLRHKTSDRRVYDAPALASAVHPLFVNGDGHVTEGAIWNIFLERDGQLLTPPVSHGLLPGILRAELLESGEAREAALTLADLADGFLLGNSVRGLVTARLIDE